MSVMSPQTVHILCVHCHASNTIHSTMWILYRALRARKSGDYGVSLRIINYLFNIRGTARTTLRAHGARHEYNRESATVSRI